MIPIRTILHPTDFSGRSAAAFRLACSLARDHQAALVVLHVVTPEPVFLDGPYVPPPPGHRAELLQRLHEVRPDRNNIPVEHRLVEGDPAVQINRLAAESRCDLIVLGTHGRTGLGRLLMGSVAEEVVRKAPCPVLTVKEPFVEAREELAAVGSEASRR
jgi:nucleotide-binding universal stress UspA family protein